MNYGNQTVPVPIVFFIQWKLMGTKTCFVINILQKIVRIDRILLFWVNFAFKCFREFFFLSEFMILNQNAFISFDQNRKLACQKEHPKSW